MSFSRIRNENLLHSMLEHGTHASEIITGTRPLSSVSNSRTDDVPCPRGHNTNLLRVMTSAYCLLNSTTFKELSSFSCPPAMRPPGGCVRSIKTSRLPKSVKNSLFLTRELAFP